MLILRAKVRPDKLKVGPALVQVVQVASEMVRLVRHGFHWPRKPREGHGARNMAVGSASPRLALATGGQDACGRRLTCSQVEGCWMWMGCGSNRQKNGGNIWNQLESSWGIGSSLQRPRNSKMTMCFEKDDLGLDKKCLEITPDFCQRPSCAH